MIKLWKKFYVVLVAVLIVGIPLRVMAAEPSEKCNLTPEEQAYVQQGKVLRVALSPDNFPYSKEKDGNMEGVFPEMLSLLSYKTGLKFQIIPVKTYEEYSKLKTDKDTDVVFSTHVSPAEADSLGYKLTASYLLIPYSKLELKVKDTAKARIGALLNPSPEATIAERYYYTDQITYYESLQACLEALGKKNCEAIVVNNYQAEKLQYGDIRNQYITKELYYNELAVAAGINNKEDPRLLSIMDKGLASIDDMTKENIINRNTQRLDKDFSLEELIYSNPNIFLGVVSVFFLLVSAIGYMTYRNKKTRMSKEMAQEYRKFIGYICTAVDAVSELNLANRTISRYSFVDGKLESSHTPYPLDEWQRFHPEDRERVKESYSLKNLRHLCETETASYDECRMWNDKTQSYRWTTCILQGIKPFKGKPFNLLLIMKDTEELKENETKQKKALEDAFALAKHASEAKGNFLSKISHEIRTPLNAIIGYLSIAKDSDNNIEKIMHCIDNSDIASRRLLSIINDVLDMSSIESGRMKIAQEDFDLKKEINDLAKIFYLNAKAKGILFEVHVERLEQEWVVGDSLRLNQVLMNLLSNAIKFTPEGGKVVLNIEELSEVNKLIYVRFTVNDNGIGMSEEYLTRLFKPFEQENAATARKYGGTGLGLSIAQNLSHMMGGSIEVHSKLGEGTSFVVTLGFGISDKRNLPSHAIDYSHVRALVVDDEQDEASYIKTMLKRCGVKADMVTSGSKALKRVESRMQGDYAYDLCIVDWNMPEMDGVEVAKHIRKELHGKMPIIIATAYDISSITDAAHSVGVDKVVSKPLFQSTLFDLLVSVFGKYDPAAGRPESAAKIDLTGSHIILAEDNAMNMEIAVTILEKAGVKVDQAVNGQEAYEKFTAAPAGTYDLILMDVQMPVLNGYDATQKIRNSSHPEAKTIPVIAMTANAFVEDVSEALSKGMNAHIAKPVNYDKLFEVFLKFAHKHTGN